MNLEFWDNRAKQYGYNSNAVNFDPIEEDLELLCINRHMSPNSKTICDLGCGNGRTIFKLLESRKEQDITFFGFDFSPRMIEVANEQKKKLGIQNVFFYVKDAVSPNIGKKFQDKFDVILTKRLLINIEDYNDRIQAVDNIHTMLRQHGKYFMIECFIEPLEKINRIRSTFGLHDVTVHSFNNYLSHDFLYEISYLFSYVCTDDFESLYYFISRIFNAALSDGKPDYMAPINQSAAKLIKKGLPLLDGYAPEKMVILQKK